MVAVSLSVCFSSNKEEGFRYFDGLMRRWNMDYINPRSGLAQIMRVSSDHDDLELILPSQADDLF
jgi:hypothetical protein